MKDKSKEWFKQAEYDFDTAKYMADGGRYFYAVFMCNLALEKAIKGYYHEVLNQFPPKTHNLSYLIEKSGIKTPENIAKFLIK